MKAVHDDEAKPQLPTRIAGPKDEKRTASHTDDAVDLKAVCPGSGGSAVLKESKLKQPEVRPKILEKSRTPASLSSPSTTTTSSLGVVGSKGVGSSSDHPTKKVPPLPNKHSESSSNFGRAESKQSDTSLHKVRSVQSLANEIRRIRSLKTNDADAKAGEEKVRKPEKKPSVRSKIKLEIAEVSVACDDTACDGAHQHQQQHVAAARSPTLCPMSTSSPTHTSSTGKKGINRNFVAGLGTNFQLDLQQSTERVDKSYDLSASGTFDAVGFQIKQSGITRSPDRMPGQQPSNAKKHLVKLGVLGRGASGVVHKALHVPSLLLVAVKVIPVFENEKRHQLIAELKALYNNLSTLSDDAVDHKTVACPEIVCLYDAFMNPNEGNVSIVVEYMDGGSLQDIVDTGGCKSESVLANISYRVLKGLQFLHSTHQLHRDIKPSNLLINHFGDVKISDFGIVREMENSMAKATTFVGTLTYMSPERIASEVPSREYSYKSDVWSFGLSIMTCALGKFPYSSKGGYWELLHMIRNEPPPQLPEGEFSDLFHDFLDKCLKKDQSERWSVKQLLNHDFVQHCARQSASPSPAASPDDDAVEWGTKDAGTDDESKEQLEVDDIVLKVTEYCMKDAKEHIIENGYTLDDIVTWIQNLPTMQKAKLARFADQIGANRRAVYAKFQVAMNELLQEIQETHFDDQKHQAKQPK
uniref:mitogen-activated protein kinase kinase n=1 Tax=Globisporangium ultimum (strain ATCC 200006 / CBS 805.95 / DAOM BR144) TaxID=431595 RepID=K3WML9_GLOUD